MGNTACTASGSTPFEAEVVIVNHTSFTLKEPQTRKCSKCSQKHHLGLQMKQGKVFDSNDENPTTPKNTIVPYEQHRFKISARSGSTEGPEGFLRYTVWDSDTEVGDVEFYFTRWANSSIRKCSATTSGEHCHKRLLVAGRFDTDDAVCEFQVHQPTCNIRLHGVFGGVIGDGKVDMEIPLDAFLEHPKVAELLSAISSMQADAAKVAAAAEKFADIAEGPLSGEVLEIIKKLLSNGVDVNVGVQWPALPSVFQRLAGRGA
mmetsp:Transcript_43548/g.102331  ORF Transcript_43548/g.102331 Transcript_43548/m.102331 type:complete len:261 (+) Transcript_43548:89-871(+)